MIDIDEKKYRFGTGTSGTSMVLTMGLYGNVPVFFRFVPARFFCPVLFAVD